MSLTVKDYFYLEDGAGTDPAGWSLRPGSGGGRSGRLISAPPGGQRFYIRNDLAMDDDEAWLIEAELSATGLGGAGEVGARMWAQFAYPTGLFLPPPAVPKFFRVEVRLLEDGAGNRRVALFDPFNVTSSPTGEELLALDIDWTRSPAQPNPANQIPYRIRLKRQRFDVGGTLEDFILLQAEPSADPLTKLQYWDDPNDPNPHPDLAPVDPNADPPPRYSQKVLVSSLTYGTPSASELGFGHIEVDSNTSEWWSIFVSGTDDADEALPTTVLPYWPAPLPAAAATIAETTRITPTEDIDTDLEGPSRDVTVTPVPANIVGYDDTDYIQAILSRIATGADPAIATDDVPPMSDYADPDNILASSDWLFTNVRDFQTVTATVAVKDRPGLVARMRTQTYNLALPDRTSPIGLLQVSKPGVIAPDPADDGDWDPVMSGCYDATTAPAKFAVRVTDWEIDPAASGYFLNGSATLEPFSGLASGLVSADLGIRRYVIDPPATEGKFEYKVRLADQQANPRNEPAVPELTATIKIDTTPQSSGVIVVSESIPVAPLFDPPDFATYGSTMPAPADPFQEAIIGIQLGVADWQLLAHAGEPGPGGEVSKMSVDGVATDMDLADFFETPNMAATQYILARKAAFDEPVRVSFELWDLCGNTQTIGPVSIDIDTTGPPVDTPTDGCGCSTSRSLGLPTGLKLTVWLVSGLVALRMRRSDTSEPDRGKLRDWIRARFRR